MYVFQIPKTWRVSWQVAPAPTPTVTIGDAPGIEPWHVDLGGRSYPAGIRWCESQLDKNDLHLSSFLKQYLKQLLSNQWYQYL